MLLQGGGFHATSVQENLTIMVMSFDSLRAKNKEDRKVFQENGNLQSFERILGKEKDITLGEVIKYLNPVVIVDESHNAESELSVEMLKELNPSFILDLTATPRNNSNLISFIDALELKKENMVKLPVIVRNNPDKTEVINGALQLQRSLELKAIAEEKKGGKYIRPIVLFQAQPKQGKKWASEAEEKTNVQKLKEKLLELNIPAEQIKIKTATINEIKGIDLMSRNCEVRFIITINALKEGWDCPFAYILASLADKNSAIDVEQILGRILRQPFVQKHNFSLLNMCYVFTASAKFNVTLQSIVDGLKQSGFSEKDYKVVETQEVLEPKKPESATQLGFFPPNAPEEVPKDAPEEEPISPETIADDIDTSRISLPTDSDLPSKMIAEIEAQAQAEEAALNNRLAQAAAENTPTLPNELQNMVKTYPIKAIFQAQAAAIQLPQFFVKEVKIELLAIDEEGILLEKEALLKGFALSKSDTNIDFNSSDSELYKIDLDENKREHTPTFLKIEGMVKEEIMAYILDPSRKDSRIGTFTQKIMRLIGNMYPIPDKEIEKYIARILGDFTDAQFHELAHQEHTYTRKIKEKITALSELYAEEKFQHFLDTDHVFIKPAYTFPPNIAPSETCKALPKSLYEKEGSMNGFEEQVINTLANLPNILFWTRNTDRKGFKINGFINHYPDFIIQTKSGKTIVLETKGDHLDAAQKIRLGRLWAEKAGNAYRYYLVYDKRVVEGAYTLESFLERVKNS